MFSRAGRDQGELPVMLPRESLGPGPALLAGIRSAPLYPLLLGGLVHTFARFGSVPGSPASWDLSAWLSRAGFKPC